MEKAHNVLLSVKEREKEQPQSSYGRYIKSIVYGGLDGIVTTFVVVAGAAGASASTGILLIFGLGSLLGDAISMAVGDYASSHAEDEFYKAERVRQEFMYENNPAHEEQKLKTVYQEKGLSDDDAHTVARILMKKKETAIDMMILIELGHLESNTLPSKKAMYTFFSFLTFGFLPLLTYVLEPVFPVLKAHSFSLATILTAVTLFVLGALKTQVTKKNWFISGFEMMGIGSFSAFIAYLIGAFLVGFA